MATGAQFIKSVDRSNTAVPAVKYALPSNAVAVALVTFNIGPGTNKKPWRQKGTGRARAGSIRSPIWVGGGTAFGPQPRDYSYRMPRTARREALLSALSLKNRDGKIIVVDKLELEEAKTKLMIKALAELKIQSALIVIAEADTKIERSARNLPKVKVLRVEGLNVYDLLCYEHLVLTEPALKRLEERLVA